MITAQDLYDRRDEYGEIDGRDLHELFNTIAGDPSPAGRTRIDPAALAAYAADCRAGQNAEYIARFCEAFFNEPCGCPACDHGIQEGHFACEQPRAEMLEREERGEVVRTYEDGAWRWIVVAR